MQQNDPASLYVVRAGFGKFRKFYFTKVYEPRFRIEGCFSHYQLLQQDKPQAIVVQPRKLKFKPALFNLVLCFRPILGAIDRFADLGSVSGFALGLSLIYYRMFPKESWFCKRLNLIEEKRKMVKPFLTVSNTGIPSLK